MNKNAQLLIELAMSLNNNEKEDGAQTGGTYYPKSPLRTGNKVFIRTVTNYYTGEVIDITADEVLLKDAAWVADTGRFSQALKTGVLNEVEPFTGVISVNRGAIVDVSTWEHALPTAVK